MTTVTVTLEVPERLAQRLTQQRDKLPQALEWAINRLSPHATPPETVCRLPASAFTEMVQFLATDHRPEEIVAFQISPESQNRLSVLLEKNREARLTESERAELDWFEYVYDIMSRLKAQVRPASLV